MRVTTCPAASARSPITRWSPNARATPAPSPPLQRLAAEPAQGKFGRFDENAVKWLAAIGTSYGAIAVRTDSPYKNLDDLVKALKADPSKVVIGSGGTVGSQDWMQTALIAKAAGINPRDLRYVALEGGGEIATALLGGHIQVGSTDISDSMPHILSGDMRLLAVFSEERLPEAAMANIPTAMNRATTSSGR